MTMSTRSSPSRVAVERFAPTNGLVTGYGGLVFVAVGIVYVAIRVHTWTGLQVALGLLCFGVVIWVTQIRSRATAYPDRLVLRNLVTDTEVPLRMIDEVSITRTLNVWAEDRRHVCVGLGRSLAMSRLRRRDSSAPTAGSAPSAELSYHDFVEATISNLVAQAKRSGAPVDDMEGVRRVPAWRPILALSVATSAFLLSLLR